SSGSGICPLPAGEHGHEASSVLDRTLANLHWRRWQEDGHPEQRLGLGLLPQWVAGHAKSQLDLFEERYVPTKPFVRDGLHGEEPTRAWSRICRVSRPWLVPPVRDGCFGWGLKPNRRHGQEDLHRRLIAVGRIPPWLHLLGL